MGSRKNPRELGPIIKLFVEVAAPIFRERFRADSCINATRVTVEVLRAFGVRAEPCSVLFVAANGAYVRRLSERGSLPDKETLDRWIAEDGAWALGVDTTSTRDGKFAGHLVAIAQDFLIDASARQFSRPERSLVVPDIFVGETNPRFRKGKGSIVFAGSDGEVLTYTVRKPDDGSWRTAPGWQLSEGNAHVFADIVNFMTEALGHGPKVQFA